MVASDGISETVEETGGKESVIDPIFDCTISVYMLLISTDSLTTQRQTYTADREGHKHEKDPEIWVLCKVYQGSFVGFLDGDHVTLFIALPRTRQESSGFIDVFFRHFIHDLCRRVDVGDGEDTGAK